MASWGPLSIDHLRFRMANLGLISNFLGSIAENSDNNEGWGLITVDTV